jgi:hypothetical protein
MNIRFRVWNIRNLYRVSSLKTVLRELYRYKLNLVGMQEVRWEVDSMESAGESTFFFLWKEEEDP